jgi:hypothetical protein
MKRLMTTMIVIAAVANMTVATDKPDFSGKWKLDLEKSSFGPVPPPATMTRTVGQKGPDITVENAMTGPEMNLSFHYSTDGKETSNTFMGTDFKSKAAWDGDALMIRNYIDSGGQPVSTNKWTLAGDGKTFTDVWSISSPDGNAEVTYVFVKQ